MIDLAETKIIKLMKELINRNGSDLHLTGDTVPFFRIQGQMIPADSLPISSVVLREELELLVGKNKFDNFIKNKDFDCSFGLEGIARFRINLFFDRGHVSCVMRALNNKIPSFSVIGLPESV